MSPDSFITVHDQIISDKQICPLLILLFCQCLIRPVFEKLIAFFCPAIIFSVIESIFVDQPLKLPEDTILP